MQNLVLKRAKVQKNDETGLRGYETTIHNTLKTIMLIFKKTAELEGFLSREREKNVQTGFVPTMGALHAGHVSLVERSKSAGLLTICSIFVNPAQFNNPEDFEKYPVTIEKDIEMLVGAGCDVLFLPGLREIYPDPDKKAPLYPLAFLETVWEGKYRPGHFQGVCRVVEKLFRIVQPHHAYFGLKDYQQCMVIRKLTGLMEWEDRLQLHLCPTLREPDGLAMSSRNMRLTEAERVIAPAIYREMQRVKSEIKPGDTAPLMQATQQRLADAGFVPDYFSLAHAHTLEPITIWDGTTPLVCLVAAFLGSVRLIDNLVL
jgi:pantoate--beta-alanine ligase